LAFAGSAFILNETAPLTLLGWGHAAYCRYRSKPVDQGRAFDQKLNPIRAKADLSYGSYLSRFSMSPTPVTGSTSPPSRKKEK